MVIKLLFSFVSGYFELVWAYPNPETLTPGVLRHSIPTRRHRRRLRALKIKELCGVPRLPPSSVVPTVSRFVAGCEGVHGWAGEESLLEKLRWTRLHDFDQCNACKLTNVATVSCHTYTYSHPTRRCGSFGVRALAHQRILTYVTTATLPRFDLEEPRNHNLSFFTPKYFRETNIAKRF